VSIISSKEAKSLLQISDDSLDSAINALIPPVESFVKTYCNTDFKVNGVERIPEAIKLPVSQLIGYFLQSQNMQGVKSESLGDHSISFDLANGFPKTLTDALDLFMVGKNKIRWD
jgi:hypothetical protein